MGIFDFLDPANSSTSFIGLMTPETQWCPGGSSVEGHEIKYGAKLTVREGQAAVFVHEGQLAATGSSTGCFTKTT